ncbi:hypothetical protein HMPREF1551_02486, partial [Capnocytophaga sp. oral taxon 863 str. F0517]
MLGVKAQAQVLKIMFIYTMNNTLKNITMEKKWICCTTEELG